MVNRQSSDEILLEAIKGDDYSAFCILFDRYWQRVFTSAYAITKDKGICTEIVHDIFLNIWLKRQQLQIGFLNGYITAAARYHVYKHIKLSKRTPLEYSGELQTLSREATANQGDENIRYQELEETVDIYLQDLPKRCKEIFTLSRKEHLSNDEIAERLDISKRSVENQLTHALRYLRMSLKSLFTF